MKANGLLFLSLTIAAACAPAPAGALRPEEVLVVVNANAAGSVALGKYYAIARNVGVDRVLALRCTPEPEVSRDEYNRAIRDPIRAYLRRHDPKGRIRCIVLMWGVPVRVAGPPLTGPQKRLLSLYKARRRRLLARMSVRWRCVPSKPLSFAIFVIITHAIIPGSCPDIFLNAKVGLALLRDLCVERECLIAGN